MNYAARSVANPVIQSVDNPAPPINPSPANQQGNKIGQQNYQRQRGQGQTKLQSFYQQRLGQDGRPLNTVTQTTTTGRTLTVMGGTGIVSAIVPPPTTANQEVFAASVMFYMEYIYRNSFI